MAGQQIHHLFKQAISVVFNNINNRIGLVLCTHALVIWPQSISKYVTVKRVMKYSSPGPKFQQGSVAIMHSFCEACGVSKGNVGNFNTHICTIA